MSHEMPDGIMGLVDAYAEASHDYAQACGLDVPGEIRKASERCRETEASLRDALALILADREKQAARVPVIERYAQAAHWYINAHDQELLEQGDNRRAAISRVHAIECELVAMGFEFVAPTTEPSKAEQAEAPHCPTCKRTDGNLCDWCPSMQPPTSKVGERGVLDPDGIERLETELFFRRRRLRETHAHPENIEDPSFFDGFRAAEVYYGITTKEQS